MSLSKPTPCLSAMPWLVKEKIVIQTDFPTRLSLCRCSKEFYKLSETSWIQYHAVCLELKNRAVLLKISKRPVNSSRILILKDEDFRWIEFQNIELAVSKLMWLIGKPSVHLESLIINSSLFESPELQETESFIRTLSDTFSNYKGSLKTETLEVYDKLNPNDMKIMVEALKPGKLKKLQLQLEDPDQRMDEVMDLEQWEHVKDLEVIGWDNIPAERLAEIPRVAIWSNDVSMSQEAFNALIQGILDHKESFQQFKLEFGDNEDDLVYTRYLQELAIAIPGSHEREKFIELPDVDWKLRIYVSHHYGLMIHKVPLFDNE